MTTHNIQRLAKLTSQLAETLMTAVICANEIRRQSTLTLRIFTTAVALTWSTASASLSLRDHYWINQRFQLCGEASPFASGTRDCFGC